MDANNSVFASAIGQDSHRFEPDGSSKPLVLGGVAIPGCQGLVGNSDADVILHALTNAISGVSGQNILGKISDKLCSDGVTDSRVYLEKAMETLSIDKWELTHVSISVEAKRPHLSDHISTIKQSIALMVGLSEKSIGLTATSGEGLTDFGRGDGVQAFVIVSARKLS